MVRESREQQQERQAREAEENQRALRRSIEKTQELLDESEEMLKRHRREREAGE